jgi:hypothetical protein
MYSLRKRAPLRALDAPNASAALIRLLLSRLALRAGAVRVPFTPHQPLAREGAALLADRCASLPARLALDLEHVNAMAAGFQLGAASVRFSAVTTAAPADSPGALFPHRLDLGLDANGALTVLDLRGDTLTDCPVYAIRADRPVVVRLADRFADWLTALGGRVPVDATQVREGWDPMAAPNAQRRAELAAARRTPVLGAAKAGASPDWTLAAFAASAPAGSSVVDFRSTQVGDAFAWGGFRIHDGFFRHPTEALFALTPSRRSIGAWAFITGSMRGEIARCRGVLAATAVGPVAEPAGAAWDDPWPGTASATIVYKAG